MRTWIKDPSRICAQNDVGDGMEGPRNGAPPASYYERLREEVSRAILADTITSPLIDRMKQYIGVEYELVLREKLLNLGISFLDEAELAMKGFKRTPDVLLDVPIEVPFCPFS